MEVGRFYMSCGSGLMWLQAERGICCHPFWESLGFSARSDYLRWVSDQYSPLELSRIDGSVLSQDFWFSLNSCHPFTVYFINIAFYFFVVPGIEHRYRACKTKLPLRSISGIWVLFWFLHFALLKITSNNILVLRNEEK